MMNQFVSMALMFVEQQKAITEGLKERALKEYEAALLMPRKKKKVAKKSALLLYSIACHGEHLLKF